MSLVVVALRDSGVESFDENVIDGTAMCSGVRRLASRTLTMVPHMDEVVDEVVTNVYVDGSPAPLVMTLRRMVIWRSLPVVMPRVPVVISVQPVQVNDAVFA